MGRTSLRAALEHIDSLQNPNPDGYLIEFANVLGVPFLNRQCVMVYPDGGTLMSVPLASQLPTITAGHNIFLFGSTNRRVTITRDPAVAANDGFRFLDVDQDAKLVLNGLKLLSADNTGTHGGAVHSL